MTVAGERNTLMKRPSRSFCPDGYRDISESLLQTILCFAFTVLMRYYRDDNYREKSRITICFIPVF